VPGWATRTASDPGRSLAETLPVKLHEPR
jgi:hypothetical protein